MKPPVTISPAIAARKFNKQRDQAHLIAELREELGELGDRMRVAKQRLRTARADYDRMLATDFVDVGLFDEAPKPWPKSYRDVPIDRLGLSHAVFAHADAVRLTTVGLLVASVNNGPAVFATSERAEIANALEFLFAEHPEYAAQRDREEDQE